MNKRNILRNELGKITTVLFDEEVESILDIVEDIYEPQKESKQTDYIKFAEKLFEKKYGRYEIFTDYPVSPSVRIKLNRFCINRKNEEMKNFIKWLVEMVPSIVGRKISVYDLYDEKLFRKYSSEQTDEEVEIYKQKQQLSKKRLIKL